jgi:hypothetical protein
MPDLPNLIRCCPQNLRRSGGEGQICKLLPKRSADCERLGSRPAPPPPRTPGNAQQENWGKPPAHERISPRTTQSGPVRPEIFLRRFWVHFWLLFNDDTNAYQPFFRIEIKRTGVPFDLAGGNFRRKADLGVPLLLSRVILKRGCGHG